VEKEKGGRGGRAGAFGAEEASFNGRGEHDGFYDVELSISGNWPWWFFALPERRAILGATAQMRAPGEGAPLGVEERACLGGGLAWPEEPLWPRVVQRGAGAEGGAHPADVVGWRPWRPGLCPVGGVLGWHSGDGRADGGRRARAAGMDWEATMGRGISWGSSRCPLTTISALRPRLLLPSPD